MKESDNQPTATELIHGFTRFRALGGVESMLQRHWQGDQEHRIRSRFIAYFDPDDATQARVRGLGLDWRHTIMRARRRFSAGVGLPARAIVYHNCWGLPFFADLDQAALRLGVLHSDWPGLPGHLRQVRGLVDGLLCVSQPLVELARQNWPDFPAERIAFLPYPVARTSVETARAPLAARPVVLGFCGRLSREQKRVARLPALWRALGQTGLSLRFEFLGDGPQRRWLEQQFAGEERVRFHGRLAGEAYWAALRQWDVIVFVSDYEGLPIALLEAMSQGVLPLFPQIGSGGDEYARRVASECLYAPGDFAAASRGLVRLLQMPAPEVQALRDRCGELVQPHLGDGYLNTFASFLGQMSQLPRVSRASFPPRRFRWSDHCPFALLRRIHMPGFWQGNE